MNFKCSEIQQYTSTSFMRYRPIIITIISLSLTDSPPFGRLASTITQQYNHLVVAVVVVVVDWVMMVEVESSTRVYPTNNNNYDSNNQNITRTNQSTTTTATKHNIQPTNNNNHTVPNIMDGTALYKVSSAQRSWSGWISPAINQSTTTSCQSIIDGAVLGEVCLRALWAKLRLYIITTLQSTYHVHRRFRRSVLMDALVPTVMTSLIYAGAF